MVRPLSVPNQNAGHDHHASSSIASQQHDASCVCLPSTGSYQYLVLVNTYHRSIARARSERSMIRRTTTKSQKRKTTNVATTNDKQQTLHRSKDRNNTYRTRETRFNQKSIEDAHIYAIGSPRAGSRKQRLESPIAEYYFETAPEDRLVG